MAMASDMASLPMRRKPTRSAEIGHLLLLPESVKSEGVIRLVLGAGGVDVVVVVLMLVFLVRADVRVRRPWSVKRMTAI
jgi:hypothetical protein